MASFVRDLTADLLTALRIDHSGVGGVYDLSTVGGTPRVDNIDSSLPSIEAPYVELAFGRCVPSYGPEATLDGYRNTYTYEWWGYAHVIDEEPTANERLFAAADLANDVVSAIENAHRNVAFTALYECTEVLVTLDDLFGDGNDIPSAVGVAHGTITIVAERLRGV